MTNKNVAAAQAADLAAARDFLRTVRPGPHRLAAIAPDTRETEARHVASADDLGLASWIEAQQALGRGVYWTPNVPATGEHRKPTKADIESVTFAHVDLDPPAGEDRDAWQARALARLEGLPYYLPKPIVVASGGGLNVLWPLDSPVTVEEGEALARALSQELGGDLGTWNADRLLRLPGTVNFPNAKKRAAGRVPTLARVLQPAGGLASYDVLASVFPPVPAPPAKADAAADIDYATATAAATFDDLPGELRSRFRAACADDRALAGLWGGTPAPGQDDTSGSGFRFELARRLHLAGGFSDTEIAALIWTCEACGELDRKTEREMSRAVARSRCEARVRAADEFDPVDLEGPAKPAGDALAGFRFDDDAPPEAPAWLVKGLLPKAGIAFVGGQSGAGKTFITVDLAAALASGGEFFGHRVTERVGVVIVAAEGGGGIANRIKAARKARNLSGPLPLAWITDVPELTTAEQVDALCARLEAVARRFRSDHGVRLGLVIVDTLAAAFRLQDENSAAEAAGIIWKLNRIGARTGALVAPVHHYGKSEETGLRGSSAFRAGADVVLAVLAKRDAATGGVSARELAMTKARDGEEGQLSGFALRFVPLGLDDDGEAFGSCRVEPIAALTGATRKTPKPKAEPRAHMVMRDAISAHAGPDGWAGSEAVRVAFGDRYGGSPEALRKAYRRARDEMTADGTCEADAGLIRIVPPNTETWDGQSPFGDGE